MKRILLLALMLYLPAPLFSEIFLEPEQMAYEIRIAASLAEIYINNRATHALAANLLSQVGGCAYITMSVTDSERIQNLQWYFNEKKRQGQLNFLSPQDIGDFSCNYVARRFEFSWLIVDSRGPTTLLRAESLGKTLWFSTGSEIPPGSRIIFPVFRHNSTVTALTDSGRLATWTGPPLPRSEVMQSHVGIYIMQDVLDNVNDSVSTFKKKMPAARVADHGENTSLISLDERPSLLFQTSYSSAGCEIYVYSTPSPAKVFFNGREWYDPTNTSSVRDPGVWEVRVRLTGYQDLVVRKNLSPGETWRVNAVLKRATR